MTRTLEEYLRLPYRIELVPDRDDEGREGWVAEVEELPGCMSQGETPGEAVERVRDAMEGWNSVALDDGIVIPEPSDSRYSGRFLLRMPQTLHRDLSRLAEREGVSLNQFAVYALGRATATVQAREHMSVDLDAAFRTVDESIATFRTVEQSIATTVSCLLSRIEEVPDELKRPVPSELESGVKGSKKSG
jgi:antitoxin HicB